MQTDRTYRVMVVEDDARMRARIVEKIQDYPGLTVSSVAGSCEEALQQLNSVAPDVLLVDLGLPDGDGTQVIAHAATLDGDMPIMVITVFGDEERVMRAIRAGATGYLLKTDDSRDIGAAIQDLISGGSPISPIIARYLIRRHKEPNPVNPSANLAITGRELEVLQLSAKGYTYQEVAELLKLSVNTVGSHTRSVYRKLAVSSRSQAVFEATRLGLVDAPDRSS